MTISFHWSSTECAFDGTYWYSFVSPFGSVALLLGTARGMDHYKLAFESAFISSGSWC